MTVTNLASIGDLLVHALPVLLLTMLVFFNSPAWVMAATVSRPRLWLALGFLYLIAAAFLVSNTFGRVRPILQPVNTGSGQRTGGRRGVGGHPVRAPARPAATVPLSKAERANVGFVLALSQLVQVLTVAFVTG